VDTKHDPTSVVLGLWSEVVVATEAPPIC